MKRVISFLLVIVLCLGLIAVPALAKGENYVSPTDFMYLCLGDSIAAGTALSTKSGYDYVDYYEEQTQFYINSAELLSPESERYIEEFQQYKSEHPQYNDDNDKMKSKFESFYKNELWEEYLNITYPDNPPSLCWGFDYEDDMPDAYYTLVKEGLEANLGESVDLRMYAMAGMRSVEMRCLLDGVYNDWESDDETLLPWRSIWGWGCTSIGKEYNGDTVQTIYDYLDSGFNKVSSDRDFVQAIKDADLITLNFGSNDVMTSLLISVMMNDFTGLLESLATSKYEGLTAALDKIVIIGDALNAVIGLASVVGTLNDFLGAVLHKMTAAASTFKENYAYIVKEIFELNPDVTLIGVGMYNPGKYASLTTDSGIKLGAAMALNVADINAAIKSYALKYKNYHYADVTGTETHTWAVTDITDIFTGKGGSDMATNFMNFAMNVHPTVPGHKHMADGILDAIPDTVGGNLKSNFFRDVAQSLWAYDFIRYVSERGLMLGKTLDSFDPDSPMTRAQFVTVLYRMAGSPSVEGLTIPFTDVPAGDYYAHDAIVWAYKNEIAAGKSNTLFVPDDCVTRQQLVTMLYNYAGQPEVTGNLNAYDDADSVSAYAENAMIWATQNGIVSGYSDGTLKPLATATRAQMAAIIANFDTMAVDTNVAA